MKELEILGAYVCNQTHFSSCCKITCTMCVRKPGSFGPPDLPDHVGLLQEEKLASAEASSLYQSKTLTSLVTLSKSTSL